MRTATFTLAHLNRIGQADAGAASLRQTATTVTVDMASDVYAVIIDATQRVNGARPPSPALDTSAAVWGPAKWAELHSFPLHGWQPGTADAARLRAFVASLPCGDCRRGAARIIAPHYDRAYATRDDYYAATVGWHDEVNVKLGKPTFGLPVPPTPPELDTNAEE